MSRLVKITTKRKLTNTKNINIYETINIQNNKRVTIRKNNGHNKELII